MRAKPIPVKLDEALLKRIEDMAKNMGEAKSTVMRIAMRVGLDNLEKAFAEDPKSSSSRYPFKSDRGVELNEPKKKTA